MESRETLEAVRASHERQLKEKDDVIESLKLKMNFMADEFAGMLQETLTRMGEKIEITSSKWEGDESVPVMKRMEDLALGKP